MATGLIFPGNDAVVDGETFAFKWQDPHSIGLPIYGPSGRGVTYLWRYFPVQQPGYYTTFFWGNNAAPNDVDSTFLWKVPGVTADTYYGAHPYPDGGGGDVITHEWEISIEQADFVNGAVVKGQWYSQAFVAWGATGIAKQHEFYWNLPNVDSGHKVTRTTASPSWGDTNPPSPALTFGDAPWRYGGECLSGILRGLQIYNDKLSEADILSELASPLSTVAGAASIWYLNLNPTPSDITDKSGQGHDPSWVHGTNRPTLYSEESAQYVSGNSGDMGRRRMGRTA